MVKKSFMNQKETDRAIKAAVDQAKKVKPVEYTIKKGNSEVKIAAWTVRETTHN